MADRKNFAVIATIMAMLAHPLLQDSTHQDDGRVESELVLIRPTEKRIEDEIPGLLFVAFGKSYHLILEPTDVFSSNLTVHTATPTSNGSTFKESTELKGFHKNKFYSIKGSPVGSLYVTLVGGAIHVEGIITHNLQISPVTKKKRSASGVTTGYHIVSRTTRPQSLSFEHDFMSSRLPASRQDDEMYDDEKEEEDYPPVVNVEIFVLVDHRNTRNLGYDSGNILRYIGIFWNSVNNIYRQTYDPQIKLVIARVMTFKHPEDELFAYNNRFKESDGNRLLRGVFKDFMNFLRTVEKRGAQFDIAMLHLSSMVGDIVNGKWALSVRGLASPSGTCHPEVGHRSCFIRDAAPSFTGILVAAHELAHTLGVPHDGDDEAMYCPPSDGFLMSPAGKVSRWTFSPCTLRILRNYVRSPNGKCTWNKPITHLNLVNQLPSTMAGNLDEQCQALRKDNSTVFKGLVDDKICMKSMGCGPKYTNLVSRTYSAVEGTPCGRDKACLQGKCVRRTVPSADQQCGLHGEQYYTKDKNDVNICSKLVCTSDNDQVINIGRAFDGTTCRVIGVCIAGTCYRSVQDKMAPR